MMAATVPVVRELSAGIKGDPYSGPAGMRGFDTFNRMFSQMRTAIAPSESSTLSPEQRRANLARAGINVLGLLTGLPTTQGQRVVDGVLYDLDQKPAPVEAARAALFGPRK
jgi:hypothetical protein